MERTVKLVESPLTIAERDRRFQRVRTLMAKAGLECIIIPHNTGDWDNLQPDLRYLTCIGGGGVAAAAVFPLEGKPIVAVRENRRIGWWKDSQNWIDDVRSPPGFRWSQFFAETLKELKLASSKIGVVGLSSTLRDVEGAISYGEFSELRRALPNATFVCATELLYRTRKQKSPEELALVVRAQHCADMIQESFRASARPGVTEHQVYADMFSAHIAAGGEVPSMLLFSAEKSFWQTQLLPTFRTLEHGDVLTIEAEPKYYGYMAQAVDSVLLRQPTELERRMFEASATIFKTLLDELRPGISYADIIRSWEKQAKKLNLVAGRTTGHGLGLGQDGPLTAPAGKAGELIVEAGDCLVLKPWVCDPDDTMAIRVGGTVIVEANGARKLGTAALEPHIVA